MHHLVHHHRVREQVVLEIKALVEVDRLPRREPAHHLAVRPAVAGCRLEKARRHDLHDGLWSGAAWPVSATAQDRKTEYSSSIGDSKQSPGSLAEVCIAGTARHIPPMGALCCSGKLPGAAALPRPPPSRGIKRSRASGQNPVSCPTRTPHCSEASGHRASPMHRSP